MRKLKFLTQKNKAVLLGFLYRYMQEVLESEEYLNTWSKVYKDAKRVEVYGSRKQLTPALISDYLRGLPIGCEFVTYRINLMLVKAVNGSAQDSDLEKYYDIDELDNFYWEALGYLVFNHGTKDE